LPMTYRVWTDVVDDPAARHLVVAHVVPKAAEEPADWGSNGGNNDGRSGFV